MNKRCGCSWSGGKDSCYALMQAQQQHWQPAALINMMNENGRISRSHGLPQTILQQQADAMGLPLFCRPSTWQAYETNFVDSLGRAKTLHDISAMVFGDIDLDAHREWEEMVCGKVGLDAILPLWQQDRKELLLQMLDSGIEAMIVSCNTVMGEAFLGQRLTAALIPVLEAKGVDPCGENGEFHTVVLHCPLFSKAIELPGSRPVLHENYWFLNWNPTAA